MRRLSIIVPTYLMTPEVRDLWHANRDAMERVATVPYEIVVIDNGSAYRPDVVSVGWPTNRGIAPAWNEGVRHAIGDVLAFVTCTTTVQPGWDAKLVAAATSGRIVAMPYTNGEKPYGIGVTGWCWVVRRDLFDEVGPFDEAFTPVQYEDTFWFDKAIYDHGIELVNVVGADVLRSTGRQSWGASEWANRAWMIHWSNRLRYAFLRNRDPYDVPPFWKQPLRDVTV